MTTKTCILLLACAGFALQTGCDSSGTAKAVDDQKPESAISGRATAQHDDARDVKVKSDDLDVTAHWAPFTESLYKFGERWETLMALTPADPAKTWRQQQLAVFLPPTDIKFGDVWPVDVENVLPFLHQLHEGATAKPNHGGGAPGAFAAVTAENDDWLRVRCRVHAYFKLKDGFYTPSQFAGDFIIRRDSSKIVAFRLGIPARRNNVDLNWETGEVVTVRGPDGKPMNGPDGKPMQVKSAIADIGYCSRLELVGGDWEATKSIGWDRQWSYRESDLAFQKRFYHFAKINWLPFEEAVAEAKAAKKPLHVVALFGVLDDESC